MSATEPVDLSYLDLGLHGPEGLRPGLEVNARAVALAWVRLGIDPAPLEVLGELLARTAAELGTATADWPALAPAAAFLDLPPPVRDFLQRALAGGRDATALAALAVHLVDVAEAAALQFFAPELPRLEAKSERTGDAARRVGAARHLRG